MKRIIKKTATLRLLVALFILFISVDARSQTFSEWFRQKATQRKYLLEQIAAFKAYGLVLIKGYDISKDGLKAIGDIKDGDFNLHSSYFSSLKSVSPEISRYPRAKDILTIQQNINELSAKSKSEAGSSGQFSDEALSYINGVYERLEKDCLQTLSGLEAVTTSGKVEMKDDERIGRIDKLYKQTLSQYGFARSFGNDLKLIAVQKKKEATGLQSLSRMYGVK